MIRMITAPAIAMTVLCIANLIAPVQAEVAVQSEAARRGSGEEHFRHG
jgi:hypothetical protein